MECFRIDESGYTGIGLLNAEQRFQGATAIAISDEEVARLIEEHFPKLKAAELKYRSLGQRLGNQPRLLNLQRDILTNHKCVAAGARGRLANTARCKLIKKCICNRRKIQVVATRSAGQCSTCTIAENRSISSARQHAALFGRGGVSIQLPVSPARDRAASGAGFDAVQAASGAGSAHGNFMAEGQG